MRPIDPTRTEALARHFLDRVREHYQTQPKDKTTVYEALNAMASVTAAIVAGTGFDERATKFFAIALNEQLVEFSHNPPDLP